MLNDAGSPKVSVIDLDSGGPVYTFPGEGMPGNAYSLTATSDWLCASIIYRATSGFVKILCSGLSAESHDGHYDVMKKTPSALPDTITGDRPTYIMAGFSKSVVSFDGTPAVAGTAATQSYAAAFADRTFSGTASMPLVFQSDKIGQQHGIAGPLPNDHYFVSQPNPAYLAGNVTSSRSAGFLIMKQDKTVVYDMNQAGDPDKSCPGYHGTALYKDTVMFGCSTGVVLLKMDTATNKFTSRRVPYHDSGSGRTTGAFHYHSAQTVVIGQHNNATHYAMVRLPTSLASSATGSYDVSKDVREFGTARPCRSGFELAAGKAFLTMFANGSVLLFDVSDGWAYQSMTQVAEPFTCSGSFPFLVMGYSRAFVVYPTVREVREIVISGTTLQQGRTMKFAEDIKPSVGLVLGISPDLANSVTCTAET